LIDAPYNLIEMQRELEKVCRKIEINGLSEVGPFEL
jgi:hypothetical protein